MPTRLRLLRSAIVVPQNANWRPGALGPGSIVEVLTPEQKVAEEAEVSPVTNLDNELTVYWLDKIERKEVGWLAVNTPTAATNKDLNYESYDKESPDGSWDHLREIVIIAGLDLEDWLREHGLDDQYRPLLASVVREFGGRITPKDDNHHVVKVLSRLTLRKEIEMSANETDTAVAEQPVKTKKSAKSASAKKSGKKASSKASKGGKVKTASTAGTKKVKSVKAKGGEESSRGPAGASLASELAPMLKGKATKEAAEVAKRLAAGERLSKKELVTLRDGINTAAAAAREEGDGDTSSFLSAANRTIRRILRAA